MMVHVPWAASGSRWNSAAVEQALPAAKIVHDPFHLSADLNKAVDRVRRTENAALLAQGDDTLKQTKFLWLTNPLNLSPEVLTSFEASLARLLNWFSYPISNAKAEGFNSVIQAIKSAARGFRNFEHYRIRILVLLGKLDVSLP